MADVENNGVQDLSPEEREQVRKYMQWLGQRGGRAGTGYRKKRGNSDYYSRMGRKGKGIKKTRKKPANG